MAAGSKRIHYTHSSVTFPIITVLNYVNMSALKPTHRTPAIRWLLKCYQIYLKANRSCALECACAISNDKAKTKLIYWKFSWSSWNNDNNDSHVQCTNTFQVGLNLRLPLKHHIKYHRDRKTHQTRANFGWTWNHLVIYGSAHTHTQKKHGREQNTDPANDE